MKKFFLLSVVVVMAGFLAMHTSCRKSRSTPTNPTPDDYRILSYTKVLSANIIMPPSVVPLVSENYRFVYNGNDVASIFITSNDSLKVARGLAYLKAEFIRQADTIFKIFTDLKTSTVKERDTFVINTNGQIIHAYFPKEVRHFTYFGKLIATEQVIYRDTGTQLAADLTYTADQGDHLYRLWNETITASFPDSGIAPPFTVPYIWHDTVLTTPLDIVWGVFDNPSTPKLIENLNHSGKTIQISGSFLQYGAIVNGFDDNMVAFRTGRFPAGYTARQFYEYYDELSNRVGDYQQLESFTTYGVNIYANNHLLWKISSPYSTTTVTYDIDADSKVTFTNVHIQDSVTRNKFNAQYKLQWETR